MSVSLFNQNRYVYTTQHPINERVSGYLAQGFDHGL